MNKSDQLFTNFNMTDITIKFYVFKYSKTHYEFRIYKNKQLVRTAYKTLDVYKIVKTLLSQDIVSDIIFNELNDLKTWLWDLNNAFDSYEKQILFRGYFI